MIKYIKISIKAFLLTTFYRIFNIFKFYLIATALACLLNNTVSVALVLILILNYFM